MKVCVLTTGFPRFKGDLFGSFILELSKSLRAQGVELEIVAPHAQGVPRREDLEGVAIERFRYMWPDGWQALAYGGGIPTNIRQSWGARLLVPFFLLGFCWRALGASRQCQLVHCHWTISGFVAYWATRLHRRPLVLSVRGSDIHLLGNGFLGWLNRLTYKWMDAIIAVSEDIARKLEESGVDPQKIRVIYNGVDERFFPQSQKAVRTQLDLPLSRFIILFIGLLAPVKGLDILLQTVPLLQEEKPLFLLVGDGPLRAELQRQVEAENMQGQVSFVGARPTAEIPLWLNAADILVLPSYSEGRPNVVLEAQACGVPVVATRVGGTPELIRDGESGLLVDSGDAGALARAIRRLIDDKDLHRRLGEGGRAQIEDEGLTWESSGAQVKAIYRQLLEAV